MITRREALKRAGVVGAASLAAFGAGPKDATPPAITRDRNAAMIARIQAAPVTYPLRFTIAGDTGAFPNPVGDAIFGELLRQMEQLNPRPLFYVNLGDFSGPGTPARHTHYLRLVERFSLPNLCVFGNHDSDSPAGWETFCNIHGPQNYQFVCGHTRFIAINAQIHTCGGPREEDLAFLEECLRDDDHRVRVVLMHMPPNFNGHYAPHAEWGFTKLEREFLAIIKQQKVNLVCCAHVIAYDYRVHEGIPFVVSGGGGWGLCSHFCGPCHSAAPPSRGSFYHFVEVTIAETGVISGRVIRAFEGVKADPAYAFTV
jgi:hypothetical protein